MSWLCISIDFMRPQFRVRRKIIARILAIAGLLLFYAAPVFSDLSPLQRMERLVMPGDVIKKHSRVEKKCDKCHEAFDRTKQSKQCNECHKEIKKDIKKKKGFHGKIKNIKTRECRTCHTEHKGRNADIIQLDSEIFDHSKTEFKLGGAHRSAECSGCHKKKGLYRQPERVCKDCHQKDEPHKKRMGGKCENCHIEGAWLPARFDHSKTKFKLKNTHRDVACNNCHVNERYDDTPRNCYFCHYLDDVHKSDRGIRCQDCHQDERWTKLLFDHDEDTEFKLKDGHANLICKDCHKKHIFKDTVKTACIGCHEKFDVHLKRFGKRCNVCHTEKGWSKIRFDHKKDTVFPLKGKHKKTACTECHREVLFEEKTPNTCSECHRLDDAHEGQEGEKCEICHDESGWTEKVVFDHGLTKFPLHESHLFLTCEDCHTSNKFKEQKVVCDSCHEDDDVHEKKLGADCELCHRPSQWMAWEFDHNEQTDFKLDGKHEGLDCHGCHKEAVEDEIELTSACYDCHQKDDNHEGQLGKQCDACHITKSFKTIVLR